MTPEMTRNQAIRRHRIFWRWLAKNTDKEKHHWPGWKKNGGKHEEVSANCFLCEFSGDTCFNCPLAWPESDTCRPLFNAWDDSRDPKERSALAKKIAELPPHPIRGKE